tara:strand:+ start:80893 stop:81366 length:474 start_codon:yes stop_codon:yes gene_type:complete
MDSKTTNYAATFKVTQTIYGAFIFGIIAFSVVVFGILKSTTFAIDVNDLFTMVVPIVALGGILLSDFLFKNQINKITTSDSLQSKLAKYQSATILKGACLEGPALLAIVATFLSENLSFLGITALLVLLMYLKFPTKDKFVNEVTLSMKEKSEFNRL